MVGNFKKFLKNFKEIFKKILKEIVMFLYEILVTLGRNFKKSSVVPNVFNVRPVLKCGFSIAIYFLNAHCAPQ